MPFDGATYFCAVPQIFEFRDGMVYVTDPTLGLTRVFPPHVFYKSFRAAAKAIQECFKAGAEVIPFPERAIAAH